MMDAESARPVSAVAPTVSDVEAIRAVRDPILRNLRITQAYCDLSSVLATHTGPGANWCTFATWASKQAGQTIRQEDLARRIEDELGRSEAVHAVVARVDLFLRAAGRAADGHRLLRIVQEVASPARALARASDAVARGNLKVFEEIGHEFARFLMMLAAPGAREPGAIRRFCDGLRPGDPPDGQALLRAAFSAYHSALPTSPAKPRAECLFLANLRIGLHEQTRLQPEILQALDAAAADPGELRAQLLERLLADAPWGPWVRIHLARWRGGLGLLDEASRLLADALRPAVRAVVTEKLTTLALPGETLRLGRDVPGAFPEHLRTLADPDLVALLATIDRTPDALRGSGADDWARLPDRMQYIADLFRARHEATSLLGPPFSPEQTRAIRAGERPGGRL